MRLMPYIYTLARETEMTGAPMVRGLMWDHANDPHAMSEDFPYQFFLGRDFLVAPVFHSLAASGGYYVAMAVGEPIVGFVVLAVFTLLFIYLPVRRTRRNYAKAAAAGRLAVTILVRRLSM